jgi:GNAT superfamily N-acetyltransferase
MNAIEVCVVDTADEAQLHDWWRVSHAGATAGRPYDTYRPWELARVAAAEKRDDWESVRVVAYDGGRPVGAGEANLPLADNLDHGFLEVYVPVEERRRGVGAAVLAAVEEAATSRGRSVLVGETIGPVGGSTPGEPFAAAHGYVLAQREGLKVLEIHQHAGTWAPLDDHVAERIGDYRIVEWGGATPEEHIEHVCGALNQFVGMVPSGDLELGELDFSPERLRSNEARDARLGTIRFVGAALAPDGSLAGYHDLFVDSVRTTQAYVGITMVLPEHRGHALGLAVKLATHRSLRARFPECELVRTGNADVNEHMNAVNERLGYRLVEQILEFQKKP